MHIVANFWYGSCLFGCESTTYRPDYDCTYFPRSYRQLMHDFRLHWSGCAADARLHFLCDRHNMPRQRLTLYGPAISKTAALGSLLIAIGNSERYAIKNPRQSNTMGLCGDFC